MKKVYVVYADNGESYEDHSVEAVCVCPTLEKAQQVAEEFEKRFQEATERCRKLNNEGRWREANDLETAICQGLYVFNIARVHFFIGSVDWIE